MAEAPPLAWLSGDPSQRRMWRLYWIDDSLYGGLGVVLH